MRFKTIASNMYYTKNRNNNSGFKFTNLPKDKQKLFNDANVIANILINPVFYFMLDPNEILYYRTSIEMVLKELRKQKGVSRGKQKGLSQLDVNIEINEIFNVTINMGRIEAKPNIYTDTLYIVSKYFGLFPEELLEKARNKKEKEIIAFLKKKELERIKRSRHQ